MGPKVSIDLPRSSESARFTCAAVLFSLAISGHARAADAATTLVVENTDKNVYGFSFRGSFDHRESAEFDFDSSGNDLTLSTTAFDIDSNAEVSISVNGALIGFLSKTPNNGTSRSTLSIPAERQTAGQNSLSFEQRTPGARWGITDVLLSSDTSPPDNTTPLLTLDVLEPNDYGFSFRGTFDHRERADFVFSSTGDNLTLSTTAFDIDSNTEVSVSVNGTSIGFLSKTPNNGTAQSTLSIPVDQQKAGQNSLSFEQRTPGARWGITGLLLSPDTSSPDNTTPLLTLDVLEPNDYGFSFRGTFDHRERADFVFSSTGDNLTLSTTAFDIDSNTEVSISVNGTSIGFLPKTPNNGTAQATLSIPADQQTAGQNSLSFDQRTPGARWGITDLLLSIDETRNIPPLADAGPDQSITLTETARLDASNSTDPDGSIVSYTWSMTEAEVETVIGSTATFDWTPESTGDFDITLVVTDNDGATTEDDIRITVAAAKINPDIDLSEYEVVWNDEFDGTSLNPSKWSTALLWGPYKSINAEQQLYVDTLGMHSPAYGNHFTDFNPFEVSNGSLKITSRPTSASLQPPARPSLATDGNGDILPPTYPSAWRPYRWAEYPYNDTNYDASDVDFLSGIITSYGNFQMTYGYIEARAKVPGGAGLWPAFWLLNTHYVENSPEIDVMEFLGHDIETLYNTYHYFDSDNNWSQISSPSFVNSNVDWTADFHTYGLSWTPGKIIWYVDGQKVHEVNEGDPVPGRNTTYTIADQAMYIIANLAVGGAWSASYLTSDDNPTGEASKSLGDRTFEIDYIRAYQKRHEEPLNLAADYQLRFSDEFNGASLNASKWDTHFLWGPYLVTNNQQQYYVDALGSDSTVGYSPFTLQNGHLSINARPVDATTHNGFIPPADIPPDPEGDNDIWGLNPSFRQTGPYSSRDFTSGVITSRDAYKFSRGYAEMRARIPEGAGLRPAFYLTKAYYVGRLPEIDVMVANGERPDQIQQAFRRLKPDGIWAPPSYSVTEAGAAGSSYADDFHTYGVRWRQDRIDWYIDGDIVHTYQGDDVAYQLMYVVANLSVGGGYFEDGTYVTYPAAPDVSGSFDIDYIRVYQERDPE